MDSVLRAVNRVSQIAALAGDTQVGSETGGSSMPSLARQLPKIVVVGGQSSGKSSVLEAVVGRDFLPRGTGIVTRRPLELQLETAADPNAREYGEFGHNPGQKYYDFEEIRKEIEAETMRHTQKRGTIVSPVPITLRIVSPNLPALSMVDMPGLTKVPIDGQPKSIVVELENMARDYVKHENVIILAVTPANADLATSDALRLAREVDPTGERTVGVLTKLDIMDPGTNCRDVLEGMTYQLRNGWIGVVNRGQADINSRMSMQDARAKEMGFFNKSDYAGLKNVGTGHLAADLSEKLVASVRRQLPNISGFVNKSIMDLQRELEAMGGPAATSRGEMIHLVLTLCRKFETAFAKLIDGGKGGGELILTVFEKRLPDSIEKQPFKKILEVAYVKRVIEEADGIQPHLVAPEAGYRRMLEEALGYLKDPCEKSVEEVFVLLRRMVDNIANSDDVRALRRYPTLRREIVTAAYRSLEAFKEDTRKMVNIMVEMERNYITAEYFRSLQMGKMPDGKVMYTLDGRPVTEEPEGSPEEKHYKRIINQVSGYVREICQQMTQTVPKAIVHCMVLQSKEKLLEGMSASVAGDQEAALKRLLGEDDAVMKRREALTHKLDMLRRAQAELTTVDAEGFPAAAAVLQRAGFAAQPEAASKPFYAVPEGHQHSDLSDPACNIALSRRKDVTLREDVRLTVKGEQKTLGELLKGQKAIVFGVPDCGKVCSETHVPGYLAAWDDLRRLGVTRLLCVAVGDAAAADAWASKLGAGVADGSKVTVAADTNGAFTRFMGMDQGPVDGPGARSLRYAAVVDDGTLLKVCVDKTPAEASASSAALMIAVIKAMH
ncbi:dynamin-related 1E-like [Micractinium conductrix]|uniref:glutaredoxin-dependent peroxiredoxin n=1 Tax=Micractinium conductrix TaxID=554055 RepID=A0A2P6VS38_9CHLO|nr:dynamin-related 1E-like [Micractinium conductrix]|eukprot:PSC76903.1 dynamin-related 1E-like [Micractinium conductrix]